MTRPPVLVTNDDGIGSEGLWHLAAAAAQAGFDVVVAAPAGEASGTGTAIAATQTGGRIEVERHELPAPAAGLPAFAVPATPSFLVRAALRGAFGPVPTYVLSGVNRGLTVGHAVLHSGTVGAAMAAANYGLTAAAFSLEVGPDGSSREWLTAAHVARQVLPALAQIPAGAALNVNVPNLTAGELRGIRSARLAPFGVVQTMLERADGYLPVSLGEVSFAPELDSDSAALAAGYASVSGLRPLLELPAEGLPWPALPWPAPPWEV
jgi:5'-nucleotidase